MAELAFQAIQRQFAAHIRDPALPAPGNIEPRRLKIYESLFYNNIEGFLRGGFPVLRSLLNDQDWHDLARSFLSQHASASPYFVDIPKEFVCFLSDNDFWHGRYPAFMLELAHYEWMELVVAVSAETLPDMGVNVDGDLLVAAPFVSPLACLLSYQWPVHRISAHHIPDVPDAQPVWLLIYRDRQDDVHFMALNGATARLLQLLQEQPLLSGQKVLGLLADELWAPSLQSELAQQSQDESMQAHYRQVLEFGAQTLADFYRRGVILGARISDIDELEESE